MSKNKAEIFCNNGDVVVTDSKGKETFRKPKTTQTISIANTLYMYEKYHKEDERRRGDYEQRNRNA